MKNLMPLIIFALYGCTQVVSQQPSEKAKKDAEFVEIMKRAKEAQQINSAALKIADEKTAKIITKAKEEITTLKEEVVELKETIHEISTPDTIDLNIGFKLLPISGDKKNR
jgi:hypothetical protein